MTGRLIYETIGGNFSPETTFKQLIEYLTLAEEDARNLSRLRKLANDDTAGMQWKIIADNFHRCQQVVSHLANSKTRTSIGYHATKSQ